MEDRKINDGWLILRPFEPRHPEIKVGKIVLPESHATGKAIEAIDPNTGRKRLVQIDTSVIYGRVIASGRKADRGTCRPFPENEQGDYPLQPGTYVKARKVNVHTVGPDEEAVNCWDVIEHQSSRPIWAPEE